MDFDISPEMLAALSWTAFGIAALSTFVFWPQIEHRVRRIIKIRKGRIVPLTAILGEAERLGLNFDGKGRDLLELAKAISQAGLDGDIQVFGRQLIMKYAPTRVEPLVLIPTEHWMRYSVNATELRWMAFGNQENGPAVENRHTGTFNFSQQDWSDGAYIDLHVSKYSAQRWLRRNMKDILLAARKVKR